MFLILSALIFSAHATPVTKPFPASSIAMLAQAPEGCHLQNPVTGDNVDHLATYDLTLFDTHGASDSIVMPKDSVGQIAYDPQDFSVPFVVTIEAGGHDLKMIMNAHGSVISYMKIGNVSCPEKVPGT